jgi:membrane-associated HD superfamily phosphohydrolase
MSPIEGLIWFVRKHAWHLVPKLGAIVSLPFVFYMVMNGLPSLLSGAVVKQNVESPSKLQKTESLPVEKSVSVPMFDPKLQKEKEILEQKLQDTEKKLQQVESVKIEEQKIVMVYSDGILLSNGKKYKIGETLTIEGKEETLKCVNVSCGIVGFVSGKTVTF